MNKITRGKTISVRVTEREFNKIQEAAILDFNYPSSWIRKTILKTLDGDKYAKRNKV
jgi:hypothetical protein